MGRGETRTRVQYEWRHTCDPTPDHKADWKPWITVELSSLVFL